MDDIISISIVIVNWNGRKWLKKCIESLYAQTYKNFEIIVVDNTSSDNSVEFLKNEYPDLKIVQTENKGFGHGANVGAKESKSDFLMFFNEDIYVDENFLEMYTKRYHELKDKDSLGTIGCTIANYDKSLPLSREIYGFGIDLMSSPTLNFSSKNIFHNTGSPFFISRKLFLEVDGFCKNIFLYSEDIDLCWRLNLYGYKHYFVYNICIYHYGGGVIGAFSAEKLTFYVRGEINSIFNNCSSLLLPFAFIYFLFFYFFLIFIYLLSGKIKYSKAIVVAIFKELRYNIKNILAFRKMVQSKRKVSDWQLLNRINFIPSRLKNFYYSRRYNTK